MALTVLFCILILRLSLYNLLQVYDILTEIQLLVFFLFAMCL